MVYPHPQVTVGLHLCEANTLCVAGGPEVVDLSADEVVDVLRPEPPPQVESAVNNAVSARPKQAFRIIAE